MTTKSQSLRRRLAGADLIGFDTSMWKNLSKRDVKNGGRAGQRSKVLAAKAGTKEARRR